MKEVILLFVLALVYILFAVIQDLKQREVANWLNFSLIVFALAFRFFYSLFNELGFTFFYQGLIGLGIFIVIGNLLYSFHFFAGGDAKLLIALGAVLPISNSLLTNLKFFALFFFIFLFSGAVYSLIYSAVLASRNSNKFKKEFFQRFSKNKKLVYTALCLAIFIAVFAFIDNILLILGVLVFIFPYLYLYAKSVEETCLIKEIPVGKLREGDWLYQNVKIKNKVIKPDWNGLSINEIKILKKYKKSVKIKEGIPFTPVFLISFLVLILVLIMEFDFNLIGKLLG